MDVFKVVRVVFGVVGVVLLVGSVVAVQHTRSFLAGAVSARGTVQELVTRSSTDSDGRSSTTFAPVVRFTTADGRGIVFVSSTSSYPSAYQVGDTVEVLYREQDPAGARIHDWFSLWGAAAILGLLGTVFSAVSAGITAFGRRAALGRVASGARRRTGSRAADDEPDDLPDDAFDDAFDGEQDEPDDVPAARSDPDLLRTGVRVHADLQRVRPAGTFADNGSENYRIVAQWLDPDRHEVRIFTSDDIPYDPTPYLSGRTVDVYIAPDDASRHYVDVSSLPRPAG